MVSIVLVLLLVLTAEAFASKDIGDNDAPVQIVMHADFECPFSARMFTEVFTSIKSNYIDNGDVNFRFQHMPLPFHSNAEDAAVAAECASEQNEFFEYADTLFRNQDYVASMNISNWFIQVADDLGMDTEEFENCLEDPNTLETVREEKQDGDERGVTGTPTTYVNYKKLVGAQSYQNVKEVIDEELKIELPLSYIAVADDADSSDVQIAVDIRNALIYKGYERTPEVKLFSEIPDSIFDDYVILAVYEGKAVIFVGRHTDYDSEELAEDMLDIVGDQLDLDYKIEENVDEVDLEEYFTGSQPDFCTDSDGGKKQYVFGTVTGPLVTGTMRSDICTGNSVRELFCNSNNKAEPTLISCPNGCEDGVCYYPGFFMNTDQSTYYEGDWIDLTVTRADSRRTPVTIDLYIQGPNDEDPELFGAYEMTIDYGFSFNTINDAIFDQTGTYMFLICDNGAECDGGVNTNSITAKFVKETVNVCDDHELSIGSVFNNNGKIAVEYKTVGAAGNVKAELFTSFTGPNSGGAGVNTCNTENTGICSMSSHSDVQYCTMYTDCTYPEARIPEYTYTLKLTDNDCSNVYDKVVIPGNSPPTYSTYDQAVIDGRRIAFEGAPGGWPMNKLDAEDLDGVNEQISGTSIYIVEGAGSEVDSSYGYDYGLFVFRFNRDITERDIRQLNLIFQKTHGNTNMCLYVMYKDDVAVWFGGPSNNPTLFNNMITRFKESSMKNYDDLSSVCQDIPEPDEEKYKGTKWTCYDGVTTYGNNVCKTYGEWKTEASQYCEERCAGNNCGVKSFSIGNTCTDKLPDLVISSVSMGSTKVDNYNGVFDEPRLVFDVTIRNAGDTTAKIDFSNYVVGLAANLNGEDIGWTKVEDKNFRLRPGEQRMVQYEVSPLASKLIHSNEIIFWIDNTFGSNMFDYTSHGGVKESNENNNKYTQKFVVAPCTDSDNGGNGQIYGEVVFLNQILRDRCNGNNDVKEYWCEGDYSIGYGYRGCPFGCSGGECAEDETNPNECPIVPMPVCSINSKVVPVYDGRCIIRYKCVLDNPPEPDFPDVFPGDVCQGCEVDGRCIPIGTRLITQGTPNFCSLTGRLDAQLPENSGCQNDYECGTNTCQSGICTDLASDIQETKSMLRKIVDWLSRWFR